MGCVSSAFLDEPDSSLSGASHHIVSLTSTTYGLLTTLDAPPPPPPPPPPKFHPQPEIINSWELMAGLDSTTPTKPPPRRATDTTPARMQRALPFSRRRLYTLDMFEKRCPPGGDQMVVLYTTTLRGIRRTFEECNAVRAALEGVGVGVREKDVSMDMGFREELRRLMAGSGEAATVPRVFVGGRDIGGAEVVLRIHEEGGLAGLVEGMPRARVGGGVCGGCGGVRFLLCFRCSGSRKVAAEEEEEVCGGGGGGGEGKGRVVRCSECNENGLVLCPMCF